MPFAAGMKSTIRKILLEYDLFSGPIPEPQPTYGQVAREYSEKELQIIDPTTLIVIDEAVRAKIERCEGGEIWPGGNP
jgi:hypothetical protein